ncbi:hypothetical protein JIG36_10545 [Actinoplanes sp. LDG1-06]|uniref:Uncharacterized protein n=1 Tax=Paractinoplanes ovalisporus TaxID=2810368 RepID=A0ABS2A8C4_9ACTN|nr:hypothetical protein [Actinoplanes ovalisporus]MBM2615995.1 hypothetical protein [Actinoplanes ovalisporus]
MQRPTVQRPALQRPTVQRPALQRIALQRTAPMPMVERRPLDVGGNSGNSMCRPVQQIAERPSVDHPDLALYR